MPFLLGDRLVGRVDVKAERSSNRLLVHGAFAEAGEKPDHLAAPLWGALESLADWLGLEQVSLADGGDLMASLRAQRPLPVEP